MFFYLDFCVPSKRFIFAFLVVYLPPDVIENENEPLWAKYWWQNFSYSNILKSFRFGFYFDEEVHWIALFQNIFKFWNFHQSQTVQLDDFNRVRIKIQSLTKKLFTFLQVYFGTNFLKSISIEFVLSLFQFQICFTLFM